VIYIGSMYCVQEECNSECQLLELYTATLVVGARYVLVISSQDVTEAESWIVCYQSSIERGLSMREGSGCIVYTLDYESVGL
jgi:hypothetical protein